MRVLVSTACLVGVLVAARASALGPAPPPPGSTSPKPGDREAKQTPPPPSGGGAPTTKPSTTPPPPGTIPPPPGGTAKPDEAPVVEGPPVDLSDTWTYNRGGSSRPRYVRSGELVEVAPNPEGYYSGVSLDGNHVPPFPARSLGTKPALLTWTGFERTTGGSRVFFEVSADVASKLDIKGSTITLRLVNTRINVRNNARYLDLRWFRTPVRSIKVSKKGKDTLATVVLKRDASPTLVVMEGKEGYRLVVLEFAGGTEATDAPIEAP